MIQLDEHIFQMGWFNHQLDNFIYLTELNTWKNQTQQESGFSSLSNSTTSP